ncbi:hypothetical protein KIN20_008683 [Parelaphostrongylus tenuis]|uniref:Ig-like domain-containing protein n=1 Tax=Parelaphostrongylus tenuis TaxID=148309 RepID=A0AAD5QKR2_PARTN|nr:hypothetical protein KIN20_008683 [Parelaphostrongylus tenuis]
MVSKEGLRTVNSTQGQPSSISCEITGDEPQIQWFKNDVALVPTTNVEFNEDKTIMNILSTRLKDEGEYKCVATNSAGKATQLIHLFVGVPPRITEGVRENLCEAVGVPNPTITWWKDDEMLTNTALDDSRNTHRKSNWAGSAHKDFDLVVITSPTIQPEKLNITAELRKTVILPCDAIGIPEPVITWVKAPNVQIEPNESE